MAEDLLLLARADAEEMLVRRERIRADAWVRRVIDLYAPLAEERGLTLDLEPPPPFWMEADRIRMGELLGNLLDNAIKFTPAGGHVTVTLASHEDVVHLVVRDSGCGIAPEHLPHVFDRFYRADPARSSRQGGTGLGLSICQAIARAHGGAIDITSTPGRGTTVSVTIPRAANRDGQSHIETS